MPATTPTTQPAPPSASPGTTAPAGTQVVLAADGLGSSPFGEDAGTVLSRLSAALGPPDDDRPLGSCPSGEADRLVQLAELAVIFGGGRLVAWDVGPSCRGRFPRWPRPRESVSARRWPTSAPLRGPPPARPDDPFGPVLEIATPRPGRLAGTLTGTGPSDTVASLSGGAGLLPVTGRHGDPR